MTVFSQTVVGIVKAFHLTLFLAGDYCPEGYAGLNCGNVLYQAPTANGRKLFFNFVAPFNSESMFVRVVCGFVLSLCFLWVSDLLLSIRLSCACYCPFV